MSEDLKKLTDWSRFKTLLSEVKKESSSAQTLCFFPFTKLESTLKKEFFSQPAKIIEFVNEFKNSWKTLSQTNLHIECNLRNSYFADKFTQTLRDELCKFTQDAFFIHAKNIQAEGPEFDETLSEIKRSVPLQNSWLRILFITHAESLSEIYNNKLMDFLSKEEKIKRHLIVWLSQSEANLFEKIDSARAIPKQGFQFEFDAPSPDETATLILHELSIMSQAFGLNLSYVDPELLAQLMSEIQKASTKGDFPVIQILEHYCASHFQFAREEKYKNICLARSWTGEITLEESRKIA